MNIEDLREKLSHIDNAFPMTEELSTPPKAKRQPKNSYGFAIMTACMVAVLLIGSGIFTANIGVFNIDNSFLAPVSGIEDPVEPGQSAAQGGNTKPNTNSSDLQKTILRLKKTRDEGYREYSTGAYVAEEHVVGAAPKSAAPGAQNDGAVIPNNRVPSDPSMYGKTNNQVANIDEADIIKNDGKYLYYLYYNKIKIVSALPANSMSVVSTIELDSDAYSAEMYIDGNKLVVAYNGNGAFGRSTSGYAESAAEVVIYDISDRSAPKKAKSFSQEGRIVSSRLMNGRLYLVSNSDLNLNFELKNNKVPMDEVLPRVSENGGPRLIAEEKCFVIPDTETPQYLIVSSINISGGTVKTQTSAVLGSAGDMYMSANGIFVASENYSDGWKTNTDIYKFAISADGEVTKGATGSVDGTCLNQFSMDEHNGYFRIATTSRNSSGQSINGVTILNSDLKVMSRLTGLARNETIKSCRFIGNTGYVVTFRQTDPLFVIDLSNPSAPKVKGELKITGFSEYLHPWDENHLIGIGPDGTETGVNRNTKISLFDVSDPSNPREVSKLVIENAETYIGQSHKVFTRYGNSSTFGLPFLTYDMIEEGRYSSNTNVYRLFNVVNNKITNKSLLGLPESTGEGDKIRGTYINNVWYVAYVSGVSAFDMSDGTKIGQVKY